MLVEAGTIAALLIVAFFFARIAHHAGLPPAASVVLVGIAAGGMLPHRLQIELTPATLGAFLPALIFEGAWDIDDRALRRAALAIFVLAVPGVLLTAAIVAGGAMLGAQVTLAGAFVLGAILSATDPVAVLSLFRSLDVPLDLRTMVEGESIANDAVAVVLVNAAVAASQAPAAFAPGSAVALALYVAFAGIAIGTLCALAATPLLRRLPNAALGIAITLAVAYGSYLLATLAGASGIFASAAAGIALRAFALEKSERRAIERFWDGTATLANGVVFLLVGLSLDLERIVHEPILLAAVLAAVIVARGLLAYVLAPVGLPLRKVPWRHAIALAGVRGGLSIALALGLPGGFPSRPAIVDAVFAVVFITIVIQGWALGPILRRIDLRAPSERTIR